jgi:serine/threonine protein kinase
MELKHIGRYDIISLIGQGGMSAVYLGYDPRSMRQVAIKILPPYYLHAPKFRERFEREALMIALLEHPAIVPVYDMGEEDDQPYIVMRYMSGGSLSEKLKKGPLLLRECMDMYLRLAPAVDSAHAKGVTHRDVKPDNLLFDKYDNVYLSDFGLARLRETIGFTNISDGSIMGTPAYMSPEQIQGDREIDGRSDIYSMGVVLFQMLTGTVPFSGATAASVMMMHLINPVPQIFDLNKTLPLAIQSVIETAMAKNPNDRYHTAGEFAKAIQAVTTGVHKKPNLQNVEAKPGQPVSKYSNSPQPQKKAPASVNQPAVASARPAPSNGTRSQVPQEKPMSRSFSAVPVEAVQPQSGKALGQPTARPDPQQKHRRKIPLWGWLLGIVMILSLSVVVFQWTRGGFPFSQLQSSSLIPSNTAEQNNPVISSTPTSLTLGKADKLAFLQESNIWVSDLDGSNLTRLTTDGTKKSNLNWSPDGQSVLYTTDNCLNVVGLQTMQILTLSCISGVSSINTFDISPDGQDVALGLNQSDLYLFPYSNLFNLRRDSLLQDLPSLALCSYYAPYRTEDALKDVNWSLDADRLAVLLAKPTDGTTRDEIQVLDFSQCNPSPQLVNEILPTYFLFTLRGYFDHPEISGLSWNADNQLLLNGYLNNSGFGDLQLYNLNQGQGQEIAPNGSCCYRDIHWSPDGTYLFYTYQPESGGEISLHYAPVSQLDQPGSAMTSLVLPPGFITSGIESLQPALRTAH